MSAPSHAGADTGRPPLALMRDDAPPAPAAAAKKVFVIQNQGLSDSVRLVVLGGDPEAPFDQRPGIAVMEILPDAWTLEEQREIVSWLEAKAAGKWDAERRREEWLDEFMRREHERTQARREAALRGWRTRRGRDAGGDEGGGAA